MVIQEDVCNGCGYCVVACPFGVIDRRERDGRAFKCTMCYDRLQGRVGAGVCEGVSRPPRSSSARWTSCAGGREVRVRELQARGESHAQLYGADPGDGVGGAGAFFLLLDEPEVYGLPPDPEVPTRRLGGRVGGGRAGGGRAGGGRRGVVCRRAAVSATRETVMVPRAEPRSYYGRPVVKPPVWTPEVPWYFFTGGLTGGAATLALAAEWRGQRAARAGARAWSRCAPVRRAPCC